MQAPTGMPTQRERIEALEAQVAGVDGFNATLALLEERVVILEEAREQTQGQGWEHAIAEMRLQLEELTGRVNLLTRAMGNTPTGGFYDASKPRVPEPRSYGGAREAKELDNFLFDMEQYFKAVKIDVEETKVTTATMYLTGDAKLWWRTKYDEIEKGTCTIDSWERLKEELKLQFFPENVEYNARRALRDLKHTGTIREYVKQFSALMLDIKDMSEKDKLFFFLEGLKPWARIELQRQRVQDLTHAQAAAECLTDYAEPKQRDAVSQSKKRGGRLVAVLNVVAYITLPMMLILSLLPYYGPLSFLFGSPKKVSQSFNSEAFSLSNNR